MIHSPRISVLSLLLLSPLAFAQQPERPEPGKEPKIRPRAPVELREDDKPAFPSPPAGWDVAREGIPHGKVEGIEYNSKTVGTRRKAIVYTPPGFSPDRKYPVLYLLHGIGGDETEWQRFARPGVLLDNLIADGKALPMIVVMPNGRAQKDDRAAGDVFKSAPAFAVFERDLLDDLIPAIEARYPVHRDRAHRAIAGLSMGGGQSLNFGLGHPDTFAWIGGFSSAPNTREPAELVPDPAAARKLELLWLSCGTRDGLFPISQGFHAYLKEKEVPHVWHVSDGAHDAPEWKQALHHFLQQLKFGRDQAADAAPAVPAPPHAGVPKALKDVFKDDVLVGTALNPWQSSGRAAAELSTRFRQDPKLNPWPDGLPPDMEQRLSRRYAGIFGVYLKHRDAVSRVTFWGVHDGASWLNHFPVRGRTNYPLLFDRKKQPKPAFDAVVAAEPAGRRGTGGVDPSGFFF